MNILLTGASGFVGQALAKEFDAEGHAVTALLRGASKNLPSRVKQIPLVELGHLSKTTRINALAGIENRDSLECYEEIKDALKQTDVIVHAAARVHIMNDHAEDPLAIYREINTKSTLRLASMAASQGVKRFIFLSTIKVNGEQTNNRSPFTETDDCQPSDAYAVSKYEAEIGLAQIAKETGMEVVIIRPPLVYGPGVKGNFASMINWVKKGVPLPLGSVKNHRSLIALENLVNFISLCLAHPKAANETFLISDGEDLSTTQLIQKIALILRKKNRLFPIPVKLIQLLASLVGKEAIVNRVFGSLQIDSGKARRILNWKPLINIDEQLRRMIRSVD